MLCKQTSQTNGKQNCVWRLYAVRRPSLKRYFRVPLLVARLRQKDERLAVLSRKWFSHQPPSVDVRRSLRSVVGVPRVVLFMA
ncbi:unspecified product [Leishmania tarentolae]|uniref:Unspecified product n=1 Tax=Leishmania tarentolae TaxID=5689 RepID=A0A640KLT0_LEITA|nr:unspecified product [Leishmania tarentolae]